MPERLKNIDALGSCYDIVKFDPLNMTQQGVLRHAIDMQYTRNVLSPDQQYIVPDGTEYFSARGEDSRSSQVLISSSSDYQKALGVAFSASGSGGGPVEGGSFSASGSYSSYSDEVQQRQYFSTLVQYVHTVFALTLDATAAGIPLNSAFQAAIAALPEGGGAEYDAFVQSFGTHYANKVTFGGLAYQRLQYSKSAYSSLQKNSVDISAGAKGVMDGITGGVGGSTDSSSASRIKEVLGTACSQCTKIGGNATASFNEWKASTTQQPEPVLISFERLSALLPADSAKRKNLDAAIDKHINQNQKAPFLSLPEIDGTASLENEGLQIYQGGGPMGTTGQSRYIEQFSLEIAFPPVQGLSIRYKAWLRDSGETPYCQDGQPCGTTGQGRPVEGFLVELNPPSDIYDVWYRAHLSYWGDRGWQKGGTPEDQHWQGKIGENCNVEQMEVRILPKGQSPS